MFNKRPGVPAAMILIDFMIDIMTVDVILGAVRLRSLTLDNKVINIIHRIYFCI